MVLNALAVGWPAGQPTSEISAPFLLANKFAGVHPLLVNAGIVMKLAETESVLEH